jgi:hypothetical protein
MLRLGLLRLPFHLDHRKKGVKVKAPQCCKLFSAVRRWAEKFKADIAPKQPAKRPVARVLVSTNKKSAIRFTFDPAKSLFGQIREGGRHE